MSGREPKAPKWFQFPWHEIASFVLGGFLLIWQNSVEDTPQPVLVGAGLALCGVAGAGAVQRLVRRGTNEE